MSREVETTVLILVGLFMGRVVVEGAYLSYVKEGLFWPLLGAVVLLIVVGLLSLRSRHEHADTTEPPHATVGDVLAPLAATRHDDHGHGPGRVGYLLLVPVAVLILVAPSPLGAFAAERATANQLAEPIAVEYPPLPAPVDGAADVPLQSVIVRSLATVDAKLEGNPVRLVGFVVPDDELGDGYRLTRFTLGCCASDAAALAVRIVGVDRVPPADTWQEVVAVWEGQVDDEDGVPLPVLRLVSARTIEEPAQPYE